MLLVDFEPKLPSSGALAKILIFFLKNFKIWKWKQRHHPKKILTEVCAVYPCNFFFGSRISRSLEDVVAVGVAGSVGV